MRRAAIPALDQAPLQGLFSTLACIEELVPSGEGFVDRTLEHCFIQVTSAGTAEVVVNGRPYQHRPGRLFAIARGAVLSERSEKPWRLRYLMLDGPWCEPLIRALDASGGGVMIDRPPRPWVEALETAVESGMEGGPGFAWRITEALAVLIGGLSGLQPGDGDLLSEVGRLVDAAPERRWSIPTLARSVHIPPRTFQQRFHELTGDGPSRWVLQRRMAHARLLLQRGQPVNRVAERLGFANPFHFSRAFKRCCGITPSALLPG